MRNLAYFDSPSPRDVGIQGSIGARIRVQLVAEGDEKA
jgi:hypothetical protein